MAEAVKRDNPHYLERCKLIRDAIGFDKPERVPYLGNYWTWKFTDAGYTIQDGARDYGKIMDANRHFLDNYHVDMLVNDGFRNPLRISDVLGATGYQSTDDAGLIVSDSAMFSFDDYDGLATDYLKTFWESGAMNKCGKIKDMTPQEFAEAAKEFAVYVSEDQKNIAMIEDEYGVTLPVSWGLTGFELLYNCFRGIKNISTDMRRAPDKVKAAMANMETLTFEPYVQAILDSPDGEDMTLPFDACTGWLGHTILSSKQFGEFYWPAMKKLLDAVVEKGKKIYIFSEGNWVRFAEYLADYPKGSIAMQVELDDIFEVREKAPNICLCGGLDIGTMGRGTPDECVEMAKQAIDRLDGLNGGFILSENKMCSYPCDSKPENIKAVVDFVQNYR